jgi:hypothetical protein
LPEILIGLSESLLSPFDRVFEGPILNFNTNRATIFNICQGREKPPPIYVAKTRELRDVPTQPQDAASVQDVRDCLVVFRMDVHDTITKIVQGPYIIDLLPD